jgi:hypothetical protein
MNTNKAILIVLTCVLLYYVYNNNKDHLFWNSSQPIYDVLRQNGIIKDVVDLQIVELNNDMEMIEFNKNNINTFINFINKHFDQYIIHTNDYIYFNGGDKYKMYGLKKNNELIGTILGKYTTIIVENNSYKSIYVDYLCINKKYRDKHYAPILISFIIQNMKNDNYPTAFYRLDNTKHHFKHFYLTSYYYYDLTNKSKINKRKLSGVDVIILNKHNNDLIIELYEYYIKCINIFDVYEKITLDQFTLKLKNNISNTIIFQMNNDIIGFITYLDVEYNIFYKKSNILEIYYYIFTDNKYSEYINHNFIDNVPDNFNYIYLLNNYYNNYLVQYLNMIETDKSYFYLYNYYLKNNYDMKNCIMF